MTRIWLSPPEVTGEDRAFLLSAIDSNWIAPTGPDLEAFEAEVARRCGRRYGVGLASGTAALHLALLAEGVGPGDEVLVPSFTFIATASAVVHCDATPVFIDSSDRDWQISAEMLEEAISDRRRSGGRVAAIVAVDLYGQCADYESVLKVARDAGIPVIEDAAEALGSAYDDRPAGSFGSSAVLSFNGNKIITTSGGGMLVTDKERIAERARHLATQAREPAVHYEHREVGFNYRLSNLLAAFGRGQLADLDRRVSARRAINQRYRAALAEWRGVQFMPTTERCRSNTWLTCLTLRSEPGLASRDQVVDQLARLDIEARPTWKPLHLQPAFAGFSAYVDGTAERLFRDGLCLPSGSGLTADDQDRVVEALAQVTGRSV